MYDLAIKEGNVYLPTGFKKTNIYIKQGKIAHISHDDLPSKISHDVLGKFVIPGIIDPHVHFNLDLGKIKSVDDFYHGSVAGVYGGVTSFIDFLDPADTVKALEENYNKRLNEAKDSLIDYSFHATFINPVDDVELMVKKVIELGLTTIKVFTTYKESGRKISDDNLIKLLKLSKTYNFLVLVHVENNELINLDPSFKPTDILKSRPTESETTEALKLAGYVDTYGGYVYMVHTSSGVTIEKLVNAYPHLVNKQFFIESCPQYFTFDDSILHTKDGVLFTFAPPLRGKVSKDKLIKHIHYVDTIGTDHCAFNKADKDHARLIDTPLGIGSIEHSFNIMYKHFKETIIPKMTSRVATIHKLECKGRIEVGYDADMFVFKEDSAMIINDNHALSDYSIYHNLQGSGHVIDTIVRGQFVLKDKKRMNQKGQLIKRGITCESNH